MSQIDERNDGDVEVIDVKLNNRKTRKLGETKATKTSKDKIVSPIPKELSDKISSNKTNESIENKNLSLNQITF